jgi:cobalt-zinc-cadmium efflux system outer membrane protein
VSASAVSTASRHPHVTLEVQVHHSWLSGLGLLVVQLFAPAVATATDGVAGTLRWSDVAAAVDRQPALLEALARERSAAGALSTAGEIPNPVFGLSAGRASPSAGGASRTEWGASVELSLDFLATRGARIAAARASHEGARHDASAARAQALEALRRSFVTLVHRQAAVDAGTELEGEVARLATLVKRRVEGGESRPTEVPRVEVELERLRSGLERARAAAEAERQRLSTWLGTPVLRVEGDLSKSIPLPPLEELRAQALSSNPNVRASRARAKAASEQVSAERWERFPKLSLGAAHSEELDRTANTLSASIALPVWSWSTGKIRQAEALADGERARTETVARELSVALADAWQGCASGQAIARRFREEVLPRAEASARTVGRAFELGETGLLDVIDARRVLLDTRREHLDALLEMQHACGALAALAELELP